MIRNLRSNSNTFTVLLVEQSVESVNLIEARQKDEHTSTALLRKIKNTVPIWIYIHWIYLMTSDISSMLHVTECIAHTYFHFVSIRMEASISCFLIHIQLEPKHLHLIKNAEFLSHLTLFRMVSSF